MKYPQEVTQLKDLAEKKRALLNEDEAASIIYHDIFDYPLSSAELIKWVAGKKVDISIDETTLFVYKKGLFYLAGREGLVLRRTMRKRASKKKLEIAKAASRLLSKIPTVKAACITGALAMGNADEDSDIDLMVITKKGTLWVTRLISLLALKMFGFDVRRFGQKNEKDKLCLNIWLDETSLAWVKERRSIYSAHEISQVKPLVNKDGTFDRFLQENSWIKDYWPNAAQTRGEAGKVDPRTSFFTLFENIARKFQFKYMEGKRTREVVTKKRALFHPVDWGEIVATKLQNRLKFTV
jgi:predicted nucleotidyltransferase